MKKLFTLILALVCVSALAACSNDTTATEATTTQEQTTTAEEVTTTNEVVATVTFDQFLENICSYKATDAEEDVEKAEEEAKNYDFSKIDVASLLTNAAATASYEFTTYEHYDNKETSQTTALYYWLGAKGPVVAGTTGDDGELEAYSADWTVATKALAEVQKVYSYLLTLDEDELSDLIMSLVADFVPTTDDEALEVNDDGEEEEPTEDPIVVIPDDFDFDLDYATMAAMIMEYAAKLEEGLKDKSLADLGINLTSKNFTEVSTGVYELNLSSLSSMIFNAMGNIETILEIEEPAIPADEVGSDGEAATAPVTHFSMTEEDILGMLEEASEYVSLQIGYTTRLDSLYVKLLYVDGEEVDGELIVDEEETWKVKVELSYSEAGEVNAVALTIDETVKESENEYAGSATLTLTEDSLKLVAYSIQDGETEQMADLTLDEKGLNGFFQLEAGDPDTKITFSTQIVELLGVKSVKFTAECAGEFKLVIGTNGLANIPDEAKKLEVTDMTETIDEMIDKYSSMIEGMLGMTQPTDETPEVTPAE